ncbi:MAG: BrnA antitoxin family protein [bacterium]
MKKLKKILKFKSEADESEFWSKNDSSEYVDWGKAKKIVMPALKPTTRSISIRLPEIMLNSLKSIANKMDIPYQSLIKMFLQEKISKEFKS